MAILHLALCFVIVASSARTNADVDLSVRDIQEIMVQSKELGFKTLKPLFNQHDRVTFKGIEFIGYIGKMDPESKSDVKNIEDQFSTISLKFEEISKDFRETEKFHLDGLEAIYSNVLAINERYRNYTSGISNPEKTLPKSVYHDFCAKILSFGRDGIDYILHSIHYKFLRSVNFPHNTCQTDIRHNLRSQQQFVYDLLEITLAAQTKGLLMYIAAVEYFKRKENVTETHHVKTAEQYFQIRTTEIYNYAVKTAANASRDIWRWDPRSSVEGETYATIGPLFRKHENEKANQRLYHLKNINNYISLLAVNSDWEEGKVVTGVRLRVAENTFKIEIEQGRLRNDSKWKIEANTTNWINNTYKINKKEDPPFHLQKFTSDLRAMCLDDVQLPRGYVVTAVKFDKGINRDGNVYQYTCIRLSVQGSRVRYDPDSANYTLESHKWFNMEPDVTRRPNLEYEVADVLMDYSDHEPDCRKNLLVNFTSSAFKTDADQNVVPYFDIQPVYSHTPMPLSGVSLFHKGGEKSAGYIGFKITTLDTNEVVQE